MVDDAPQAAGSERQETASPHSHVSSPQDGDAFRQYQQFLEFQKFQEWQRQQGGGDGTTPPPGVPPYTAAVPPKRPLWRRGLGLLRFKLVRRLLYVLLVLLLVYAFLSSLGGGGAGNSGGTPGAADQGASPVLPDTPRGTIIAVYDLIAGRENPGTVCVLFTPPVRARFAADHGAPDCTTAAEQLSARVTDSTAYKNPEFPEGAVKIVGAQASVSSCLLGVRGGPRLGKFGLRRQPEGGWLIDGYEHESACPSR